MNKVRLRRGLLGWPFLFIGACAGMTVVKKADAGETACAEMTKVEGGTEVCGRLKPRLSVAVSRKRPTWWRFFPSSFPRRRESSLKMRAEGAPSLAFAGAGMTMGVATAAEPVTPVPTPPTPSFDPTALLGVLRDVRLPAAVTWWPPAPGWWVLLGVGLLGTLAWRYGWYDKCLRFVRPSSRPPPSAAEVALEEIARLRAAFEKDGDVHELASALSGLLRRVSMKAASREEVAALTGEDWLRWLDERVEDAAWGDAFRTGAGRVLAEAPYRSPADVAASMDGEALLQLCERWVSSVLEAAPGTASKAVFGEDRRAA